MIRFLQTPGRAKKIFLSVMLLFICVMLVISLGVGGFDPDPISQPGVVAQVGDEKITSQEVRRMTEQAAQQQGVPRGYANLLASQIVEQLIAQRAMVVEAQRLGLKVSDEELRDELRNGNDFGQTFFPGGNYVGQEQYERIVRQEFQRTPAEFEKWLKQRLLSRKLVALIQDSAAVAPNEVEREALRQGTRVKFDYAVITTGDLMGRINPSEAELRAYYESRKANYNDSIPEKRRVKYAVADLNKLQSEIKISPEEVTRYYRQNQEQYRRSAQVNASHILVKTPFPEADGKVDEKAVEAARQKAESLLKQLKAGAKFEEMAKKHSDDPTNASKGGSLGWFQRGSMVPEFESVAFSLPKGQISDLVKTSYGFHIIRVDDKREADVTPLAEVQDSIEQILRQEKAQAATETLERMLAADATKLGLEAAAKKHGLEVLTSGWVSRGDSVPGIGAAPEFMETVFAAAEKSPPDVTRTAQSLIAYQVAEVKPPQTPTFEEIRQQVAQQFRRDRAQTLLLGRTQQLSDRARAEHNLKQAARELGVTVKSSELVDVNSQVPDLGSMSGPAGDAFKLKVGEISGPIYNGPDGAVLMVTQRKEPTAAELQKSMERVREELLQRKRNEMLGVYFGGLRQQLEKEGKLKVNQDELKILTRNTAAGS